MAYFWSDPDSYNITPAPGRFLSDAEFRYHNFHYKDGYVKFEEWIKEAQEYTNPYLHLNYLTTLAKTFVQQKNGWLPNDQLFNLEKWLRGRQVCYYHHLLNGDADDGHLRPILIAIELIQVFRPMAYESVIARCTPVNLHALVVERGSALAQTIFASPRPLYSSSTMQRSRSESSASASSSSDTLSLEDERERKLKLRRMSDQSWRKPSASSVEERGRRPSTSTCSSSSSRSSSSSSSASFMSAKSWRSNIP